jgi:predicted permease
VSVAQEAWARLLALFRKDHLDREFDEEASAHIAMATEDYVQRGIPVAEAQRLARVKFGSVNASKDAHRDSRGLPSLDGLLFDLRLAFRGLRRDRAFALAAITMLALAIGLNVTVFTVMNAMLFRGLPLATRSDRLAYLAIRRPADMPCCPGPVSYADLEAWRSQAAAFTGLALTGGLARVPFRDAAGRSIDVDLQRVSANTFELLGVRPIAGRDFAVADEALTAAPVAIISHRFWERGLFKRPDAIGAIVHIDNVAATIVGVMPEGFALVYDYDLWLPITPAPALEGSVIGRLRDDATLEEARAQIETITHRLHSTDPARQHDVPRVATYSQAFLAPDGPMIYGSLWVGSWFVLLVACANLANLAMARTQGRWREISTRIALGAGLWRMARLIVVEHLTLAVVAGTLAWGITRWGVQAWAAATASRYLALDYTVNSSTLLYLMAITGIAAVVVTLVPILKTVQLGMHGSMRNDTRGGTQDPRGKRLGAALVASQMALALVLLLGAGVLVRSFEKIVNADTGVQAPSRVVVGWLRLSSSAYPTADAMLAFYDQLDAQVRTIPGVEHVALASTFPTRTTNRAELELEGIPSTSGNERYAQYISAGSEYFRVMGVSAVSGREFNGRDDRTAPPVAIVNQRFVDLFWPKVHPIGRRFRVIGRNARGPWRTVVGVVPNIMQGDATRQAFKPVVYVPALQQPGGAAFLFARTDLPARQAVTAIRTVTRRIDPDVIEEDFTPLTERFAFDRDFMDLEHAELGKHAGVAPIFATIALFLSAVGLFAVIARSVTQRTKEIAVRIAVGASWHDIRRLILRDGMRPVAVGLIVGLGVSLAVNRILQSQLVGVSPYDPFTLATAPAVLILVALLACQIPVRRAVNLDPVVALRDD